MISTSEHSIFKNPAKNDGLRVRTIEVSEKFTSSAQNSDTKKKWLVKIMVMFYL